MIPRAIRPSSAKPNASLDKALAAFEKIAADERGGSADWRSMPSCGCSRPRFSCSSGTGPGIEEARRLLRDVTTQSAEDGGGVAMAGPDRAGPGRATQGGGRGPAGTDLQSRTTDRLLLLKARAEKVRQPAVAALTLKGLLDQNPKNVEVLIELADAYTRAGRAQQAVDLLREKLPEFEGSAPSAAVKSLRRKPCTPTGRGTRPRRSLTQLMQADPNDATPTMSLAQQLRERSAGRR